MVLSWFCTESNPHLKASSLRGYQVYLMCTRHRSQCNTHCQNQTRWTKILLLVLISFLTQEAPWRSRRQIECEQNHVQLDVCTTWLAMLSSSRSPTAATRRVGTTLLACLLLMCSESRLPTSKPGEARNGSKLPCVLPSPPQPAQPSVPMLRLSHVAAPNI